MRLSDVKGERTLDVIAELIDPVANIAEDEEASAMFKKAAIPEGMTAQQFAVKRVRAGVPTLLKKHKADIVTALSVIAGIDRDEYQESLTIPKLVNDITDLITDPQFMAFFTSAQSETTSGSV